eukprot:TRINITY_DN2296_c0_g2_i1.p1 TRINITY_DN2296_c0_g2~~TRINITY_DN2296_c0_g2_i1.p1  ORF type:complete len:534 (-),score=68.59 TRINITY_DN2296_c0_g2_i1:29-1447(-)
MPASVSEGDGDPSLSEQGSLPASVDPEKLESTAIRLESIGSYGTNTVLTRKPAEVSDDSEESDELFKASTRHPCMDVARIICIGMVCVDHGGTTFGVWNVMFVQSWVLQYLFLISGVCFGMTSRSIGFFVSRLAMYFGIGVACNLCAWIILGKDWQHNMWNVVFQFWFVVALGGFVVLLTPLKMHCRAVRDRVRETRVPSGIVPASDDSTWNLIQGLTVTAVGYICLIFLFSYTVIPLLQFVLATPLLQLVTTYLGSGAEFWGLPTTHEESRAFISQFFSYFELSLTNIYLVVMFPTVSSRLGLVVWLVLLNTYSNKMILYRAQEARMINGFDCVMLGLVTFNFGMAKRWVIGKYIIRYWFVVLFICAILWRPGSYGRLDEHPPTNLIVRMEYNLLEFIFVVIFFTALERGIDEKIFSQDKLDFLGNWAMLLFLVHKAVHMLFDSPYNWFVLLGLTFPCWMLHPAPKKDVRE